MKYALLIVCIVYSLFYFLPVSKEIGIMLSVSSHVFAAPAVFKFPTFLSVSTVITVFASLMFHIINDAMKADEDKHFRRFDHGWSVFLIYAVVFRTVYKKIPEWALFVLVLVCVIPAAFLTNPRTYLPLTVIATVAMVFILYQKFNRYLMIAFLLYAMGMVSRFLPILDNKYHRHSIWHALVFSAVYYVQLGIEENEKQRTSRLGE